MLGMVKLKDRRPLSGPLSPSITIGQLVNTKTTALPRTRLLHKSRP